MLRPIAARVARSVICVSVCLSVCLSVAHTGKPGKTTQSIEMTFAGGQTRVGQTNYMY